MRFQMSQVMDAIEQRLTTDVVGAQAVVDVSAVVRHTALDHGRAVSLVRIGMVIDALARYLVDEGALLYAVVDRTLLSEQGFTSKERMVLGRWADDGLLEVTADAGDRVLEIAELTGLPLIVLEPLPQPADRYERLGDRAGRLLGLRLGAGVAVLRPLDRGEAPPEPGPPPAVGRAPVTAPPEPPEPEEPLEPERLLEPEEPPEPAESDEPEEPSESPESEEPPGEPEEAPAAADDAPAEPAEPDAPPVERPQPGPGPAPRIFTPRGATRAVPTRISWHRFLPEELGPTPAVLRHEWRCQASQDCPAFGPHRALGQPVPRLRGETAVCPRHDEPLARLGPRPPAYPVSIVVYDLPRRRLVVRPGAPVSVGSDDTDPAVVSVAPWLHPAAAAWVGAVHLRLEAGEQGLSVVDRSGKGTMVWQRKGPDDVGSARPLFEEPYLLGEWDSVMLYTGVEVARGDRRMAGVLRDDQLSSVLRDAPTAAYHHVAPE